MNSAFPPQWLIGYLNTSLIYHCFADLKFLGRSIINASKDLLELCGNLLVDLVKWKRIWIHLYAFHFQRQVEFKIVLLILESRHSL